MRRLLLAALAAVTLFVAAPVDPSAAKDVRPPRATTPACPNWPMYGQNPARTFSTDCPSRITKQTVATLLPAWVLDTHRPITATPAVVDGVVYVGSWEGVMYAVDADTGRVRWTHSVVPAPGSTFGPIVSSAAVTDVRRPGGVTQRLVLFGAGPRVYALDAANGAEVWVHDASLGIVDTPVEYESSPLVAGNLVLIGRDTHDETDALTGGMKGGLVALDVRTGAQRWVFAPEGDGPGVGCGGIWGSPTYDADLGYVFVGTANCPHDEVVWTPYTNAVTALKVGSGRPVWSFQPYRPDGPGGHLDDDTDFGATPNLFVDRTGRKVVGVGKKDGTYYALDPATGTKRWEAHVVDPVPGVGGFIGSAAVADGRVFGGTAISLPPSGSLPRSFHAIDGATGAVVWQNGAAPTYGAAAEVNGVVFNAALDDLLKAFDATTGRLLWASPLTGPGSSGPVIVGDMVFIGAGTSSSDLCGKDHVYDEICFAFFDGVLGELGGLHAFRLPPKLG